MNITAGAMKKKIMALYERLDSVSPLDCDCGKLCGEVCCVYDVDSDACDKLGLYLMPGEELMYLDSDDFNLYCVKACEIDYPYSWKDDIYLVECVNPPHCDRKIRPIQCRTFPLIPHISRDGKLHLIFDENEFPYDCPIITEDIELNSDFIMVNYDVWSILIKNPLVYDLIEFDSRRRDNKRLEYQIII